MAEKKQAHPNHRSSDRFVASLAPVVAGVWSNLRFDKIAIFIGSLFLFTLAIILMKEGARSLAPLVRNSFHVDSPVNSLGFGWLFAYMVMSGSPVAASALAFFDAGALSVLDTFTMITGSRLGASFIVLFVGFIYVIRGHDRAAGLSMGLISLTVTFTTYVIGLLVGIPLLQTGALAEARINQSERVNSLMGLVFDPVANLFMENLPRWGLFLVGFALILTSFNLFDRCLPQMTLKESQFGRVARMVYRPWVMFLVGGVITTLSMSVSVSLSILVPLSNRGFIRRENVIPYIMGANITTFIDTLLATVLIDKPDAFTIVLAQMLSVLVVSVIILATSYRRYERAILSFVAWVTANNRNLAFFMITIFVAPLILLFL